MGTKQKRNPRQCQLDAYVAVLKALSIGKLDWSKTKLLADLRKHLSISQDESLKALDTVLKDPEVIAIRDGKHLPTTQGKPGTSDGNGGPSVSRLTPAVCAPMTLPSDNGARCQIQGQDKDIRLKDASRKRTSGSILPPRPSRVQKDTQDSIPEYTPLLKNSIHGSINQLVGRKVERFRSVPDVGWVHAVISDYDSQKEYHCVTFNFNLVGQESWEWVDVQAEVEAAKLRILPGLPVNLKIAVPSVVLKDEERAPVEEIGIGPDHLRVLPELCVPYEDSFFMQCLQTSALPELERMLNAVVTREQSLFDQFIGLGEHTGYQADPLVSALIEKEKLKRREKLLMDEIRASGPNESNGLGP